jgi:hypothetical protein
LSCCGRHKLSASRCNGPRMSEGGAVHIVSISDAALSRPVTARGCATVLVRRCDVLRCSYTVGQPLAASDMSQLTQHPALAPWLLLWQEHPWRCNDTGQPSCACSSDIVCGGCRREIVATNLTITVKSLVHERYQLYHYHQHDCFHVYDAIHPQHTRDNPESHTIVQHALLHRH